MADNRWTRLPYPPNLKKPEIEVDTSEGMEDSEQRERKRWGRLTSFLRTLHDSLVTILAGDNCNCFRWIYQTTATVDDGGGAQVNFVLPAQYQLENNNYQLVFARGSFQYFAAGYTITEATNTITFAPGVLLGETVTIYALRHDDVQEVNYETVTIPSTPYTFNPPVLVDRNAGRQLVLARSSHRFLDSGRAGDEYTVSPVVNALSFTSGLGPVGAQAVLVRLRECGVIWHEEVLATGAGQVVYTPANPGNVLNAHQTLKMIVTQRTTFLHPGADFITNPGARTLTINAPGLAIGQPINIWMFR